MPPLSNMSIGGHQAQSPPEQSYQTPSNFYQQQPPPRQQVHSPAEARIHSWADQLEPQQPKPMPPVAPVWSPDMGIKFAGSAAAGTPQKPQGGHEQGGGNGPVGGQWEPSKGIRFG
jgi:programmed cell death 6-interacting protein